MTQNELSAERAFTAELVQKGLLFPCGVPGVFGKGREFEEILEALDRLISVTARGDVCNKIGTYLKALAAHDNGVPFYAAMPISTLDMRLRDGLREIPIEERSAREVTHLTGRDASGELVEVQLVPDGSGAANPAFDVTPARLVTGLITERGVVAADEKALRALAMRLLSKADRSQLEAAGNFFKASGAGDRRHESGLLTLAVGSKIEPSTVG